MLVDATVMGLDGKLPQKRSPTHVQSSFLPWTAALYPELQLFLIQKAGGGARMKAGKLFMLQLRKVTSLHYPIRRFPYEIFWSLANC